MFDPRLRAYRGPAAVLVASLLLQASSAAVLFVLKLGPGAARVKEFYLGSEARFTAPKTLGGLLEVALPHLVAIPLAIFVAGHLVGFAGALRRRAFATLAAVSFASALGGIACGFAVRFVWPWLAWAKVAALCTFELSLVAWALLVAYVFFWPARVRASATGSPWVATSRPSRARRSPRAASRRSRAGCSTR